MSALPRARVPSLDRSQQLRHDEVTEFEESTGKPCLTSSVPVSESSHRPPAPFSGFPPGALSFYAELEDDNSRTGGSATRPRTTVTSASRCRAPRRPRGRVRRGEALPAEPRRALQCRQVALQDAPGGAPRRRHEPRDHVQVSADGLRAGGGFRTTSPAQTSRFRAAVDAPATGAVPDGILEALRAKDFDLIGDFVETNPRGYAANHPRIEMVRHKGSWSCATSARRPGSRRGAP